MNGTREKVPLVPLLHPHYFISWGTEDLLAFYPDTLSRRRGWSYSVVNEHRQTDASAETSAI